MIPLPTAEAAKALMDTLSDEDREIARMLSREFTLTGIGHHLEMMGNAVHNRLVRRIRPRLDVLTNVGVAVIAALSEGAE